MGFPTRSLEMGQQMLRDAIERNPAMVSGEWVFRGTRVPLTALFENLKDGASIDEFLEWFPGVKRDQALAVFESKHNNFQ